MPNYNEVRESLVQAIKSFQPNLIVYSYVPRTGIPPLAILQPSPQRTIDYLEAQSSRSAKWRFTCIIAVGLVDSDAAQKRVGDLITPGSELLKVLNGRVAQGYSQVTDGAIVETMMGVAPKQGLYTCARLNIVVLA
jgi:hypothetical protein